MTKPLSWACHPLRQKRISETLGRSVGVVGAALSADVEASTKPPHSAIGGLPGQRHGQLPIVGATTVKGRHTLPRLTMM